MLDEACSCKRKKGSERPMSWAHEGLPGMSCAVHLVGTFSHRSGYWHRACVSGRLYGKFQQLHWNAFTESQQAQIDTILLLLHYYDKADTKLSKCTCIQFCQNCILRNLVSIKKMQQGQSSICIFFNAPMLALGMSCKGRQIRFHE